AAGSDGSRTRASCRGGGPMIERFLLDTNIIAEIVKQGRDSGVVGVIAQMGEDSICTSAVVASELRFRLDRRGPRRCRRKSSAPCASPRYCPMPPAARSSTASSARRWSARAGEIGPDDLRIAAHAYFPGTILVTGNVR